MSDPSIPTKIMAGELDEELDAIRTAILTREDYLAKIGTSAINIGDTVRFNGRGTKYLTGLPATVVKINRETFILSCPVDPRYRRFSGCSKVKCSKELIAV